MSLIEEVRTVRERIAARLEELEPLVREYNELKRVADEMGLQMGQSEPRTDTPASSPGPVPSASVPAAASESAPAAQPRRQRRRQQSSGRKSASRSAAASSQPSRADNDVAALVLKAVAAEPGKTVAEYGEILNVAPTALYRPVRELTNDGAIVKRARQLFPA